MGGGGGAEVAHLGMADSDASVSLIVCHFPD